MTDSALKNCPFCGGAPDIRSVTYQGEQTAKKVMYFVMCQSCDAAGGDRPTKAEAIAAWNRRVENVTQ